MKISDIAMLRTKIEIALYALAHIQNRFKSDDVQVAEDALSQCRDCIDEWLKELPHEVNVKISEE